MPLGLARAVMTQAPAAGGLLLDTISATGLSIAISSGRKLRAAHAGPAIRVVRSSDSGEADIGFDGSGNLDEAALLAHTGSSTGDHGDIKTYYDNSPNGLNVTRLTTAMLRIVVDGVVQKQNGRPCGIYNAALSGYASSAFTAYTGTDMAGAVVIQLGTNQWCRGLSTTNATGQDDFNRTECGILVLRNSSTAGVAQFRNGAFYGTFTITNGVWYAFGSVLNSMTGLIKSSGGLSNSVPHTVGVFDSTKWMIGANNTVIPEATFGVGTKFGEAVAWLVDPTTDLDTVLANQHSVWGAT